jgi:hypothetical protein
VKYFNFFKPKSPGQIHNCERLATQWARFSSARLTHKSTAVHHVALVTQNICNFLLEFAKLLSGFQSLKTAILDNCSVPVIRVDASDLMAEVQQLVEMWVENILWEREYSPKDYSLRIFENFLKNEYLNHHENFNALENVPGPYCQCVHISCAPAEFLVIF